MARYGEAEPTGLEPEDWSSGPVVAEIRAQREARHARKRQLRAAERLHAESGLRCRVDSARYRAPQRLAAQMDTRPNVRSHPHRITHMVRQRIQNAWLDLQRREAFRNDGAGELRTRHRQLDADPILP